MKTILSIENTKTWSWGIVIDALRKNLSEKYQFVRMLRLLHHCPNPRCPTVFTPWMDDDLIDHFDVVMPQNHDGARQIKHQNKVVARIGGMDMSQEIDPKRYVSDFEKVGAVIATNHKLLEIARASNPNAWLIPNGVEMDRFSPIPRPDRPFTVGFAGNIHGMGGPYKGWKLYATATVNLASEGVQQRYVLHKNAQLPHDKMPSGFYHLIDALILPSQGEGCSNVVTEALACGVPVILTQVGYHGEMLTDGENCLFVEPRQINPQTGEDVDPNKTINQIMERIRQLRDDTALYNRIRDDGRSFAGEHHDIEKVSKRYDEVFQFVIKENENADG